MLKYVWKTHKWPSCGFSSPAWVVLICFSRADTLFSGGRGEEHASGGLFMLMPGQSLCCAKICFELRWFLWHSRILPESNCCFSKVPNYLTMHSIKTDLLIPYKIYLASVFSSVNICLYHLNLKAGRPPYSSNCLEAFCLCSSAVGIRPPKMPQLNVGRYQIWDVYKCAAYKTEQRPKRIGLSMIIANIRVLLSSQNGIAIIHGIAMNTNR